MMLSQQKCREFREPTPRSFAVRAKVPSSRSADYLIEERIREEAVLEKNLEFQKNLQKRDMMFSWLKSSDSHFQKRDIERQVVASVNEHRFQIQEKRKRLRDLLEEEEQQLLQELEERHQHTTAERQAWMREQVNTLKERRERDRQQFVSDKVDQLFREECDELRSIERQRMEQQLCLEIKAQQKIQQEQLRLQQQEDEIFHEMWEADWRVKEEQEAQRLQRQQQANMEQLGCLKSQMEAAEQQRQELIRLKEENAKLMWQQWETDHLQEQRDKNQKLRDQKARRRELDHCMRVKTKRLAQEQQEELKLDTSILQQMLMQHTDEKKEAAERKAQLAEDQQRFQQYFDAELEKQKREEKEMEVLMAGKLTELWAERDEKSGLEQEARDRLMKDVMETRKLQIQHKLDMEKQKQEELSKESEEMTRLMEEMRLKDEEKKRCQRKISEAYQAVLQAQMEEQQQLLCAERARTERDSQQRLMEEEVYNQKKDELLSRPTSHTMRQHPFRRAEAASAASAGHFM